MADDYTENRLPRFVPVLDAESVRALIKNPFFCNMGENDKK